MEIHGNLQQNRAEMALIWLPVNITPKLRSGPPALSPPQKKKPDRRFTPHKVSTNNKKKNKFTCKVFHIQGQSGATAL